MATYKVPQDVEADDKLLGPFSFKQFVFLMIAVGLGALAYFLATILLPLVIIPIPFALFFLILALPLRKDQPMEVYFAAIVSFYTKPRKKLWQPDSIINMVEFDNQIVEESAYNTELSYQEARERLSFLTNVVDTQGQSAFQSNPNLNSTFKEEIISESSQIEDIHDTSSQTNQFFDQMINQNQQKNKQQIIEDLKKDSNSSQINNFNIPQQKEKIINNLANNDNLSIQTISSELKRRNKALIDQENANLSLRK